MKITVNGDARNVPAGCTAQQLVALLELGEQRVAMEVNLEIVPRSDYANFQLSEGDKVEVVRAIGGGAL